MPSSSLLPTYARSKLSFTHGKGSYLFDTQGEAYLDFAAGVAVNSLGHSHPALVTALQQQAARLWHTSNLYTSPEGEAYASALMEGTNFEQCFFTNSGAEALEGALKTARRYHYVKGNKERWRVITMTGAFHGRTFATIAATGSAKVLEGFGPPVEGFDKVPFGNMNALRDAITGETAAILVEPIQGEGGIIPAPEGYLQDLRRAADEYGLLLIFDEVQCGMGRTGKLFAHSWSHVAPDIMALAKGIGGGFPLGAFVATGEAAQGMSAGAHGSTYGGNPLAVAVGQTVLKILNSDGFMDTVITRAAQLRDGLTTLAKKYPECIEQIRGIGLMQGIKLHNTLAASSFTETLRSRRLLSVPAGENTVRLLPPLNVNEREVQEALSILDKTFGVI